MRRSNKAARPTLIQTILRLAETEPAFASVDASRVADAGDDFYARTHGMCGEFLVSRETITQSQLDIALAEQAKSVGDNDRAIEFLQRARTDIQRNAMATLQLTGAVVALIGRGHG